MKTLLLIAMCISRMSTHPLDSTFLIRFDKVHEKIIQQFIRENESFGFSKEMGMIIVTASAVGLGAGSHEWSLFATARRHKLKRQTPNYISEVDGYAVAFYAQDVSDYIKYPKWFLDEVDKRLMSKLEKDPPKKTVTNTRYINGKPPQVISTEIDDRPLEKFANWKVTFEEGKPPVALRTL